MHGSSATEQFSDILNDSYPNMTHTLSLRVFIAFKGTNFYIVFTAAVVVPCRGPKTSPRTPSIVQIILSFLFDLLRSRLIFREFKILFDI